MKVNVTLIPGIALYVSLFLVFQYVCSIVCDCVSERFKGLVFECVLNKKNSPSFAIGDVIGPL